MNQARDEAGLTLVEMLVAITLMAIIGMAIVGITFVAFRSYNKSKNTTQEMQQARLAMEYIVRELRVAKLANITNPGTNLSILTYQSWNNDTNRRISLGEDCYLHFDNGNTDRRITRSTIQGFTCSYAAADPRRRIINITIVVSDSTSLTSAVRMLNID